MSIFNSICLFGTVLSGCQFMPDSILVRFLLHGIALRVKGVSFLSLSVVSIFSFYRRKKYSSFTLAICFLLSLSPYSPALSKSLFLGDNGSNQRDSYEDSSDSDAFLIHPSLQVNKSSLFSFWVSSSRPYSSRHCLNQVHLC